MMIMYLGPDGIGLVWVEPVHEPSHELREPVLLNRLTDLRKKYKK